MTALGWLGWSRHTRLKTGHLEHVEAGLEFANSEDRRCHPGGSSFRFRPEGR
jgi:hypothetical protein